MWTAATSGSSRGSVRNRSRGTPPCDALICTSDRDGWDGGSDHRMRRLSGTAPDVGAHKGRRGPDGPSPRPSPIAVLGVSQAGLTETPKPGFCPGGSRVSVHAKTEEIPRGVVG